MSILNYFPCTTKIKEPRPNQIKILNQIESKILTGSKKIIIVMPAGAGKSILGYSIPDWYTSTQLSHDEEKPCSGLVLNPYNSLVGQYSTSFNELGVIKTLLGRNCYPCIAKKMKSNCDDGFCQSEQCTHEDDEQRLRITKEKLDIERNCNAKLYSSCLKCECNDCIYKKIKLQYVNSRIGNSNFSLYSLGISNKPDILIIDECRELEDTIRMTRTVTIPEPWGHQSWLDYLILLEEYVKELNLISVDKNGKPKPKIIRKIESINNLISDYKLNHEQWNIRVFQDSVLFEPITITRFIDLWFENKTVVMMSATPERLPGWDILEVDSEIPPQSVPWVIKNLGRMTLDDGRYEGSQREKTIPKICDFIADIEGKVLVHCGSYQTAVKMAECLRSNNGVYPLMQTRKNYTSPLQSFDYNKDSQVRNEIIDVFKRSQNKDQIALTVELGVGTDIPDPGYTNVIACLPQQNRTDSLTKAKIKLMGESWIDEWKSSKIMQMDSRTKRGILLYKDVIKQHPDMDWLPRYDEYVLKPSWILDSNFNNGIGRANKWFEKNKGLFYSWFLQRQRK